MPKSEVSEVNQDIRRLVDAARGVWTRRLIDHSRRNSLLFFTDLKVGTLDLTKEKEAVKRLISGDGLRVDDLVPKPKPQTDPDYLTQEAARAEKRSKVGNALTALQRKALSNLEEKGIETLHLAMGMATWPAEDEGTPYNAPVILLPAQIQTRGRAGSELRLTILDEPQINPVLLYVLEENFSIKLKASTLLGVQDAENGPLEPEIDPDDIFARLKVESRSIPNFTINPRVVLGNFQFAKLAMVEDLNRNFETISKSPIVAAIAGHDGSRKSLSRLSEDLNPAILDERSASSDFLVLDADSSQHRVIALVSKGQSGVVQGPPGTGKSQTIANIIAQSVSEGKRVLFVAEKRAALDAVIKRLNHRDIDLGHIVLDLHGASVSRKDVIARIASALGKIHNSASVDGAEAVHREMEARRKTLNEHARRVNEIRQPTGLSINRMIGRLLRLPEAAKSEVKLRGETLSAITPERYDEIKQLVVRAAANPSVFLGTEASPWNNADITDGQKAQQLIDLATKAAFELWPRFEALLSDVLARIGILPPATLDDTKNLLQVLSDIRYIREHYDPQIFSENLTELNATLAPAGLGFFARMWAFLTKREYRQVRKRLLAIRTSKARSAELHRETTLAEEVLQRWRSLGASSSVPECTDKDTELSEALEAMTDPMNSLAAVTRAESLFAKPIQSAFSWLYSLAKDQRIPYQLPEIYELRMKFTAAGLDRFVEDLRDRKVANEHWQNRFEYVWLHSALDHALSTDPALASFNGRAHEKIVEEFCRLDRERIRLASARIRRVHAERAVAAMNDDFDQANVVKTEVAKKSRHIPIRRLLAKAPDVLTRISPCWVASPLSVSQLLDGGRRYFDLVVFDEASQILQEEAVPALYRAEQVVVAGDRHQLPPTTFFATAIEGEDEIVEEVEDQKAVATATAAIGGFDSLLGTLEAFLPNWMLEWHYRSEDERLIAFSNTHIYNGRLVTFPSARGHEAIKHILVPHDRSVGSQEESSSPEVIEVVKQVLLHAKKRPNESLGVITMGIKHANRVQAMLDRALEKYSSLADFFSLDREQRFFIKNLETVQGDERDAIILSIGYSKSANGDLPHRFGPLTQEVGYRRLNVAVTRAKRRMLTISSFSYDDVDLNRSGSRGVELLKLYLAYAASGGTRLPPSETAGGELNSFEADIRDALEMQGIKTRPQYGASRYRIDLVAMHSEKPGRPVLAIECDGATYHSSATARDRDRLRQEHLQRLGWRFHRIWSTDWFYCREEEINRAVAAYEDAVCRADMIDSGQKDDIGCEPPIPVKPEPECHPSQREPKPEVPHYGSIEEYSDGLLLKIAKWIASDRKLRTDEEMIEAIFRELPYRRLGGRIRKRLEKVAKKVRSKTGA